MGYLTYSGLDLVIVTSLLSVGHGGIFVVPMECSSQDFIVSMVLTELEKLEKVAMSYLSHTVFERKPTDLWFKICNSLSARHLDGYFCNKNLVVTSNDPIIIDSVKKHSVLFR